MKKGFFLLLWLHFGGAALNFLTALGSKQVSPLLVIWVPWIVAAVISIIVIAQRKDFSKFFQSAKKSKALILSTALFDTIAWVLFAIALFSNELAITTAITESYVAIAVFLGIFVNKERIFPRQYLGAGIALTASIVLALL